MQIQLSIRFLAQSYHGREWPPAPVRLFQALVAAWCSILPREKIARTDLIDFFSRLEALPPPLIYAEDLQPVARYRAAVPNNDEDIGMKAGYSAKSPAELNKKKSKRLTLREIQRYRPTHPVQYLWTIPDKQKSLLVPLSNCAEQITSLGRGIDFVAACVKTSKQVARPDLPCWVPKSKNQGTRLRVPISGTIMSLVEREQQRRDRMQTKFFVSSIPLYRDVYYSHRETDTITRPWYLFELMTLDGRKNRAWQHGNGVTLAAMVRHALLNCTAEEDHLFVSGHGGSNGDRLSWIPLPSVGHYHADCHYRRVLILGPRSPDPDRIRRVTYGLHGAILEQHGKPVGRLFETDKVEGAVLPFIEQAKEWVTATPVILPGRTTKGGDQKGKLKPRKIDKLVRKSFHHAGYPIPEMIQVQQAPFHRNGNAAQDYRVAGHMRYPRYHVRVRFRNPVQGPVVAGVGRHYGLGLFTASGE